MVLKSEEQNDNDAIINIAINIYNWKRLNALKSPGDSFNSVISRLLDEKEAST